MSSRSNLTGSSLLRGLLILATALGTIPLIMLLSVPSDTLAQGLFGVTTILLVAALKPFTWRSMPLRFLMLATAGAVVLRYWMWRFFETLPSAEDPVSLAAAWMLFAVETYAIVLFFLNAFLLADPLKRGMPEMVPVDRLPTVDILVPSYNEPIDLLSVTLAAARNIHYPAHLLNVVLCDDGGTDQKCTSSDPAEAEAAQARRKALQALCEHLGATYLTRERNVSAKAGNLNSALGQTRGEFVAVFDADHIPSSDFLARTVGFLVRDPKLFLVQTPHFFINKDPIQRNLDLPDACPAENEMFYALIQKGLDRWDGAFFCGSAALLRRAALDAVGGFSGQTITEDAETALDIHARGWHSLYIGRALIAGLQPETFSSFIQQRGRWAAGMMQILRLKNPIFRPGLTLAQRLCYYNSMSYWFFPVVRLIFLLSPLLYLFFGLQIFVASFEEALVYTLTYLVVSFLVQNALFSSVRWPLISEVYEIAQTPYLIRATLGALLRPRGFRFQVTAKDETVADSFLSPIYRPLLVLFLLMAAGVAAAGLRWVLLPDDRQVVMIVGGWALFNFLITGFSLRAVVEKRQRRVAPRVDLSVPARLEAGEDETALAVEVVDASTYGARLRLADAAHRRLRLKPGQTITFQPEIPDVPRASRRIACEIRSLQPEGRDLFLGLRFLPDQDASVREAVACLVFSDSGLWEKTRRSALAGRGLLAGMAYVFWRAATTIPRTSLDMVRLSWTVPPEEADAEAKGPAPHILAFGQDPDEPLPAREPEDKVRKPPMNGHGKTPVPTTPQAGLAAAPARENAGGTLQLSSR
ncbi:UDP-forming cellulose synthase catalytic subunit [Rhodobacter sp. NSM]|uniref:UDP-forming cellulose synthase catalytic subunit n=1 Tax=Rhodobacter sp. NSM TaxID=3457501 RepID=UPI003FD09DA3